MSFRKITTVKSIVDWRLCLGCGACHYICPEGKIRLVDALDEGIRPLLADQDCSSCTACLDVCPGYENDHRELLRRPHIDPKLADIFGPVLEVWEGFAVAPDIRHRGASGGLITALSLFCLEQEGMEGVLQTAADPIDPVRNRTRMSRSRAELLANTGSRYAPASVCDRLDLIESATKPCVFIGQPSEVTAMRKAQKLKPVLSEKVGLAISFFCAGSPSTRGTLELLKSRGYQHSDVAELRYRGLGWPGMFAVRRHGETEMTPLMTYKESWGFLQRFRPFALHLCPDSSGEDADISCADPWYREIKPGEPGFSLVVVRTERGRELLKRAIKAGYVQVEPADANKVLKSQAGLAAKRAAIGGRIATMQALGLPRPRLQGFGLFRSWRKSSTKAKLQSIYGTARRIWQRRYYRPYRIRDWVPISTNNSASLQPTLGPSTLKPIHVCVMGAPLSTGNRGVSALGVSIIKLVKEANPVARLTFLLGSDRTTTFEPWIGTGTTRVDTVNFRMSPWSRPTQQIGVILLLSAIHRLIPSASLRRWIQNRCVWIRTVATADFVGDIRGGDSFSDIYGLRRFVLGCLPRISVIWLRGHIWLLPQTYGPFQTGTAKRLARYILRRSNPVMSRDRQSLQTISSLVGNDFQVHCVPDVAFVLPVRQPEHLRTDPPLTLDPHRRLIGLNVNGLMYHGGYNQKNMFGLRLDYPQFLIQLIESFLSQPNIDILLVPHTFAPAGNVESDPSACAQILGRLPSQSQSRVHLLQGEYDQSEIKGVIGRCDFFIGSRMHACIAALSQGIPAIGVAYSKKFIGVFSSVGMEEAVIDGRESDVSEALKKTMDSFGQREQTREILNSRLHRIQSHLKSIFSEILEPDSDRASPASGSNMGSIRHFPLAIQNVSENQDVT